ncbi:MAG: archaellar assembly protein FlaJ [Euryarchaeota archaeon]|nr:archaellar assembly protein FlaJ [Euryarchaeota archaeon]
MADEVMRIERIEAPKGFMERVRQANNGKIPFEGLGTSIRYRLYKFFVEDKFMGLDILFMITYMASILSAQPSRPDIFGYTGRRSEYLSSRYIRKADLLVKRWGYSYVEALNNVSKKIDNEMLFSMINRYASSIEAGVADDEYILNEYETIRNIYSSDYDQSLASLKLWGDAYISLLFTAALVGIILMVSMALFVPGEVETTYTIGYLSAFGVITFGLIMMFKAVPIDPKTHGMDEGSAEQNMIHRLERKIVPVLVIVALLLFLLGMNYGLVLILVGLLLLPLGMIGYIDDSNIVLRDSEFPTMIRGIGSIQGGRSCTMAVAIEGLNKKSIAYLLPLIKSAYTKLNLGLDEKRTWQRFINESGSFLIYKYLRIYQDALLLGSRGDVIGKVISQSMLDQVLLRDHRQSIVVGFIMLLIPMHALMCGLFLALYAILATLATKIQELMAGLGETAAALSGGAGGAGDVASTIGASLFVFENFNTQQVYVYVLVIITMLLIGNTLAAKVVADGDRYLVYLYGSVLSTITGILIVVVPIVVNILFVIPEYM